MDNNFGREFTLSRGLTIIFGRNQHKVTDPLKVKAGYGPKAETVNKYPTLYLTLRGPRIVYVSFFASKQKRDDALAMILSATPGSIVELPFKQFFYSYKNPDEVRSIMESRPGLRKLNLAGVLQSNLTVSFKLGIVRDDIADKLGVERTVFEQMLEGYTPMEVGMPLGMLVQRFSEKFTVPREVLDEGIRPFPFWYYIIKKSMI